MAYDLTNLPEHLGVVNFNGKRYNVLQIDHFDETGKQVWHMKDEEGNIQIMEYEKPINEYRTV